MTGLEAKEIEQILSAQEKSFPLEPPRGATAWSVHDDFMTPLAVIDDAALSHNLAALRSFCDEHAVAHAPHGKTTMSPQLIRRQLDTGVWGLTAATPWQARVMFDAGARRVMIANECVDSVSLDLAVELHTAGTEREILLFVDSADAVAALAAAVRRGPDPVRRFPVLIDVGAASGRAGVRTSDEADRIAALIADEPAIELAGVAGFEGILGLDRSSETLAAVQGYLSSIRAIAERLAQAGRFRPAAPIILSAGGSAFFDQVVDVFGADPERFAAPVEIVIRPGAYIVHDGGGLQSLSPFEGTDRELRTALFVWSTVLSVPEPGLALLDAGKRDLSTEAEVRVAGLRRGGVEPGYDIGGVRVSAFNDQHGYLRFDVSEVDVRVGDRVLLAPSHACITFDKWRAIPIVGPGGEVLSVARTRF